MLMLSKSAYIAMCILELSNILMYKFHDDYIENKYGNNSKLLLFTDTDTLMYATNTEDVCEDFSNNKEMFDFSNYLTKSKYYDDLKKLIFRKIYPVGFRLNHLLD